MRYLNGNQYSNLCEKLSEKVNDEYIIEKNSTILCAVGEGGFQPALYLGRKIDLPVSYLQTIDCYGDNGKIKIPHTLDKVRSKVKSLGKVILVFDVVYTGELLNSARKYFNFIQDMYETNFNVITAALLVYEKRKSEVGFFGELFDSYDDFPIMPYGREK